MGVNKTPRVDFIGLFAVELLNNELGKRQSNYRFAAFRGAAGREVCNQGGHEAGGRL